MATWQEIHDKLKADFLSGDWMLDSYTIDGRYVKFRTVSELQKAIDNAATMAALESGEASMRTVARNGGRR